MESLEISNFLTIKKAKLELKKINLIIGEQATGKSIIAKVIYFFQDFFSSQFIAALARFKNQRELKKEVLDNFERFFPKYTWLDQEFKLMYQKGEIILSIEQKKNQQGSLRLNFTYSDYLKNFYLKCRNKFKKIGQDWEYTQINNLVLEAIEQEQLGDNFTKAFFIPASRSFFTNLQKNVFTLLANNLDIDPFVKEFGSVYEIAKRQQRLVEVKDTDKELNKQIKDLVKEIIKGDYAYEDEQDWIYYSKQKKINLIHASSGQQEALPMLLVLSVIPLRKNLMPLTFFIEEPEAHLFPFAQKYLVTILALLYQQKNCNFFITTHSPYILTAFNNLIMAGNVKKKASSVVNYEEVTAYTLNQGIVESILDSETNLIGTSIIDSVSDVLNEEFDQLINISLGH